MTQLRAIAAEPVAMIVNGQPVSVQAEPRMHLADLLRETLTLTGTHLGCEQGVCGACTVLIDGIPQRSCIAYAADCAGSDITTIEGFDSDPTMAALRAAFTAHHALQCGFCTPGMLITARDIVLRLGEVDEARIRHELAGNLCRCTGYVGIVAAIAAVAQGRSAGTAAEVLSPVREAIAVAATQAASTPATPAARLSAGAGGQELEQRFVVAADPASVWAVLSDPRAVAACLPGAELTAVEGDRVQGRIRAALGPIKVAIAGEGVLSLDHAARAGVLAGRGRDAGTGSSAEGEVRWQALPHADGTEVVLALSWRLSGMLAQFGRGGLVRDVARRMIEMFAAALEQRLRGGEAGVAAEPAAPPALNMLALLWAMLRRWVGLR